MKPFKDATNHEEQGLQIEDIRTVLSSIRAAHTYQDKDVRSVCINNLDSFCTNARFMLSMLHKWTGVGSIEIKHGLQTFVLEPKEIIPYIIGLSTVNNATVKQAGWIIDKSTKLSFVVMFQFQLEHCLTLILKAVYPNARFSGFKGLLVALHQNQLITASEKDELYVPAMIRNSLHANGIHHDRNGGNSAVSINGYTYNFDHGKHVQCAGYSHIANCLENSALILSRILAHPAVVAVSFIPDAYASTQP